MPDLSRNPISTPVREARHGIVTKAPAGLGQPFTVGVPEFDDEPGMDPLAGKLHAFEIRRWQSRATTIPAVGDEVLVVVDDVEEPWVAAWWPAGGDAPIEGGGGGDKNYVHEQGAAAAKWTVKHGLGKIPSYVVFDSTGQEVIAEAEVLNSNEVALLFNAAISGKAVMN